MTTPILTERQRQVVTMYAYGMTYEQIAAEMGVSERTATKHIGEARARMEERLECIIPNAVALIAFAITLGEIEIEVG
jgi:DNA-binding NarL/FixJ family response regulator